MKIIDYHHCGREDIHETHGFTVDCSPTSWTRFVCPGVILKFEEEE